METLEENSWKIYRDIIAVSYSASFNDYFLNTEHAGFMLGEDVIVLSHNSANPFDQFRLFLLIKDNMIVKSRFESSTTPALIAAGEYVCRWLEGRPLAEVIQLTPESILSALGLDSRFIYIATLIQRLLLKMPKQ